MTSRAHYDAARTRLIVDIHFALQEQNFVKARDTLEVAFLEYPEDTELKAIQRQAFQVEQTANIAVTLFRHGCRKIQSGNYDAGIEKLRQARQLIPSNGEIQAALFDSLTQFAKIVVDRDPDRARTLLREAARISPLNLKIEKIGTYLAGRVRQRKVDECLMRVKDLRSIGQYREALVQIIALENQIRAFPAPALEHARQELVWDLATESSPVRIDPTQDRRPSAPSSKPNSAGLKPASDSANTAAPASLPISTKEGAESWLASVAFRSVRSHVQDTLHEVEQSAMSSAQAFAQPLQTGVRDGWNWVRSEFAGSPRRLTTAIGAIQVRIPWRSFSQNFVETVASRIEPLLDTRRNLARDGWNHARRRVVVLPKTHPLATGITCVALVFAAVSIGRPTSSRPVLNAIGTGKLLLPVTLFRKPAPDGGIAGSLKSGEAVELLQQVPVESLDSWTLIRPADRKGIVGYVRLRNLDEIRTANLHFNLWYALSFLDRSTSRREFRKRLDDVEALLSRRPSAAFREDDRIDIIVSKSFVRLAAETTDDPQIAGRDLEKAESYLMRVQDTSRNFREVDLLKWSIQTTRAALTPETKEADAFDR